MRAREVDDDRVGGRLERGGVFVAEAEEEHVGAGGSRLGVRDEIRERAVQARVERRSGAAGERVRAERDDLEPGVREHAVEGLLTHVPGAADDRSSRHYPENYTEGWKLCSLGDGPNKPRPVPGTCMRP